MVKGLRTWIEVDTKRLKHNYRFFRRLLGKKVLLLGVVKSNAYGHGLVGFSRELQKQGIDWLGVDSVVEGLRLREKGIKKPILVLGYTLPENFSKAAKSAISITVSTREGLREARRTRVHFHLKIDSGMHRQGILPVDMPRILAFIKNLGVTKGQFEGLYTHLAAPGSAKFRKKTKEQIAVFRTSVAQVRAAGYRPLLHAAATNGALLFPEAHFDMVRIGMGLYGAWPSKEVGSYRTFKRRLKPILEWKTIIAETKSLPKGASIGYDFTATLKHPSKIAICPVGYWHGYPRLLSNRGKVLVAGRIAPILGRVSMDMIAIDITGIPRVSIGSEVVLIGTSKTREINANELAEESGTTAYEILTRLNPLIKKEYR
ncbi:MAG TPA: alanine racemase [Candidatus Paceibacterota bacterium]